MVEVSLTVGKLDASLALLLTKDHHLIEFPTILLPDGISAGSIIKINCDRDIKQEIKEKELFDSVQDEIYNTFGKNLPQAPLLKVRNVTQTSCVLEWEPLDIGTAFLKSLTLYKNGTRLGQIPNPLLNTTTKLSGLPVDTPYSFQLRMKTSAGEFNSKPVNIVTHKMTDLSGINVCLGEIDRHEDFTVDDIKACLTNIGAKPLQSKVEVDTTHFVCTVASGPQWEKAVSMNIPVVRPEWLKACELERRIIGVRMFYLDADPAVLKQRNYWKSTQPSTPVETASAVIEKDAPSTPVEETSTEPSEQASETPETSGKPEEIDPKEFDSPSENTPTPEEETVAPSITITPEPVELVKPAAAVTAPESAEAQTEPEEPIEEAEPETAVEESTENAETSAELATETEVERAETEVEHAEPMTEPTGLVATDAALDEPATESEIAKEASEEPESETETETGTPEPESVPKTTSSQNKKKKNKKKKGKK